MKFSFAALEFDATVVVVFIVWWHLANVAYGHLRFGKVATARENLHPEFQILCRGSWFFYLRALVPFCSRMWCEQPIITCGAPLRESAENLARGVWWNEHVMRSNVQWLLFHGNCNFWLGYMMVMFSPRILYMDEYNPLYTLVLQVAWWLCNLHPTFLH